MAKEYIERVAVKFAYEMSLKNDTHRTEEASRIHAQEHRHILHLLDKIPAADVVEVVRCRECKHGIWDEDEQMYKCVVSADFCEEIGDFFGFIEYEEADFYCGRGERRDNNAAD